ncbi:hypothetical protein EK904_006596, partial [Melospiza melodia maxima]
MTPLGPVPPAEPILANMWRGGNGCHALARMFLPQLLHLRFFSLISEAGKDSLPSWLHWNAESSSLEGLPLDTDKGVHYISVTTLQPFPNGSYVPQTTNVFSVEVHQEDHNEPQSVRAAVQDTSDTAPFVCGSEEPVTILTVILDADLTKMTPKQRIELLNRMRSFSEVELHNMKLVPVVNNRLFDMSAFMAGPGNAKKTTAPPVREPIPLPRKPTVTIRTRGPIVQTPTLGPIQPTRVAEGTGTATPPSTTRSPISKLTTASPPSRVRTTASGLPRPWEPNEPPKLTNHIDRVDAWEGTYFEVKIPSDTFYDKEDTTTDKLQLTLKLKEQQMIEENSWVQFNSTSQLMYGMPDHNHIGKHEYFMYATDKGGLFAVDAFEIHVHKRPHGDKAPVKFKARLEGDHNAVVNDIHKKIMLVKKLALAFGDRNSSTITVQDIAKGSIVVEWTNNTLPLEPCPREQIRTLSKKIADDSGRPSPAFSNVLQPEFKPLNVSVVGSGSCRHIQFVPVTKDGRVISEATPTVAAGKDPEKSSEDDVYLHTVIPAVVVAAILL